MKPKMPLIVALFSVLFLLQCKTRAEKPPEPENKKIRVVSVLFPSFDFTREIAGDRVNLLMLLPPGSEPHSYEPSPQDIITIQNCQVFIYGGGESDSWVKEILESLDTRDMRLMALMDTVETLEEEIAEGMQKAECRGERGSAPEYDEHVWTSPRNARRMVGEIARMLCEADPENAPFFKQNAETYQEKLDALDRAFQETVSGGVRKTIVFGDRFPFRYFAEDYGLRYAAAFPGCSSESEPSAATVAFLITKIRSEGIPVIFHVELSNERMADIISEETGAKKRLFHACHAVSKKDFEQGGSYISFMRQNLSNLKEALR